MFRNYMESLAINAILTALRLSVKNPEKAAHLRQSMLEIYVGIRTVYADDPSFR